MVILRYSASWSEKKYSHRDKGFPKIRLLILAGAITAFSSAGCATIDGNDDVARVQIPSEGASIANGEGQRPLEADALRALLSDAYATPVRRADVITDHPPGEIFSSDGRYVRIRSRTRLSGTFEIRGNLVCVQGPDIPRLCRRIIARNDGTYALVDPSNGSTILATIILAGSCVIHAPAPLRDGSSAAMEKDLRRLNDVEIRERITGRRVSVDQRFTQIRTSPFEQHFRGDGVVSIRGDRASVLGTYEIREQEVCIQVQGSTAVQCYAFYLDTSGNLYIRSNGVGPSSPERVLLR